MADEDMQYNFTNGFKKRGLVYIIVNERFSVEGYPDRCGAYTDYKNMKKLFKPLNLKLMTFYDKTGEQIKSILRSASKRPDLSDRPCFICVISSHGEQWSSVDKTAKKKTIEHAIVGTDGIRVLTKDLVGFFSEDKCCDLRDKPKLFFIQACRESLYSPDRSKALDPGVAVQYVVSAKLSKHRRIRQKLSLNTEYDSKPNPSDVPLDALDHIIGSGAEDSNKEEEEEEEEDQFIDGYDTATTDGESDADDDREEGHDDVRNLDRESRYNEYKNVLPEVDVTLEKGIQGIHIEAVTPTDLADAGKRATRRMDTEVEEAEILEVTAIPCHEDMLVMFASPPGKLAWRSTTEGGWLLANLYNVFKHYIHTKTIQDQDFLTILIKVSQDISLKETNTDDPKYHGMKMVPTIYHRLTKEIVMSAKDTGLMRKLLQKMSELTSK